MTAGNKPSPIDWQIFAAVQKLTETEKATVLQCVRQIINEREVSK